MPLPGSKREKDMLEQLKPAPAPKARTRRSSFLQEIVEPENMVPAQEEEETEEE